MVFRVFGSFISLCIELYDMRIEVMWLIFLCNFLIGNFLRIRRSGENI